jgi:uncharacterized paraquat-inducible protein A
MADKASKEDHGDLSVTEMLKWISKEHHMSKAALSRMFQTSQSTIHYWMTTGKITHKNLMKVRASYFYLQNAKDPHHNERQCLECEQWLNHADFREGKAICRRCENTKNLQYYRSHREVLLGRRRAKSGSGSGSKR